MGGDSCEFRGKGLIDPERKRFVLRKQGGGRQRREGPRSYASNWVLSGKARGSRCVIHIGMHKTGSTSIQQSLKGFGDDRFLYADLGRQGNHSLPMYTLFSGRPEHHHLHRVVGRDQDYTREYAKRTLAALERAIGRAGSRTLLISGEDIGPLAPGDVETLAAFFHQRFKQVEVVAYVRSPASYLASGFQQRIQGGGVRSFDIENVYRPYQAKFTKFDRAFGRENVHLWPFDVQTFPDGCVVRDFCDRLGIGFPSNRIVRVNQSLSRQAVGLLYTYHVFTRADETKRMRGPEALQLGELVPGDKFRFSPEIVHRILEAHRNDIEWMERRLGLSLSEDLGPHREGDIRSEADLLRPDQKALAKLLRAVGRDPSKAAAIQTPEEVAALVQDWYQQSWPRKLVGRFRWPWQKATA